MVGLIIRRLLFAVPLLFVVSLAVFALQKLVPGDAAQTLAGGLNASPQAIEQVRHDLHLDDPFLVQYGRWIGGVLHFDFGDSLYSHRPVADELAERVPVTLGLAIVVFALAIPLAWVTGVVGGLRPGGIVDRVLMFLTSLAISMPAFWVALVLVTVFAIDFHLLPPFGYTKISEDPAQWFRSIILPAIALALASMAALSRQVRAGLSETMQSAFIRTAWAKGGNTRQVVAGHALKNSAIPAVTVMGLQVGAILGGTVLIEQIFSIPGIGIYMYNAVIDRDLPVIQAVTMLLVLGNVLANLVVDITYGYLNPKVRS